MNTITIGIPTYNRKDIVCTHVKQMLNNNVDGFEIVVIDNYSTDGTFDELLKINDQRLKVYQNDENIGFIRNYYTLIDRVSTPYILIVSDEDIVEIDQLERVISDIQSGRYDVSVGAIVFNSKNDYELDYSNADQVFELLGRSAYISGTVFRVESLLSIPCWDFENAYPDLFCLTHISCNYKIVASGVSIYHTGKMAKSYTVSYHYLEPKERLRQMKQSYSIIEQNKYIPHDVKIAVILKIYSLKFWGIRRYELLYRDIYFRKLYCLENLRQYYIHYVKLFNDYILDIMQRYHYSNIADFKMHMIEQNALLFSTLYSMEQLENARAAGYEVVVLSDENEDKENLNTQIKVLKNFGFVIDEVVYGLKNIGEKQILFRRQYNDNIQYDGRVISYKEIDFRAMYNLYFSYSHIKIEQKSI